VLAGVSAEDLATTMRVMATVKETLNHLDKDGRHGAPRKQGNA
jgi:hypothetical protein